MFEYFVQKYYQLNIEQLVYNCEEEKFRCFIVPKFFP